MPHYANPMIVFQRMRGAMQPLFNLPYLTPDMRKQLDALRVIYDKLEPQYNSAFIQYSTTPLVPKLSARQQTRRTADFDKSIGEVFDRAKADALAAIPLSANPYAGTEWEQHYRKYWWFITQDRPGGDVNYRSYVPPNEDD